MLNKNSKQPRILLAAYDCAPRIGSGSNIGWQWYSRLSQHVPITLVTHVRNRDDLLQAGIPLNSSEVIFIDTEWFAEPLYKLVCKLFPTSEHARALFMGPDFFVYDWIMVRQLKARLNAGKQWDIIHSVSPLSPVAATRLHVLKRPVILGPWNGGLKSPKEFSEIMRTDSKWLYPIRHLGYLVDFLFGTTRHASIILTATQATLQSIPARYRSRCQFLIENGVDLDLFSPTPWPPFPSSTQPLKILFVGRFQAFKGLPMLFEAIASLKTQFPIQLTIIGEGPLRDKWQNQANQLKINHLITWYGQAKAPQVAEQMQQAHVLCLPSVRESGGAVLLEAMACARPLIALKYGGPAEIVDDEVGYAIPTKGGATQVISDLADSLADIFKQPAVWQQRGIVARQRAEDCYSWDAKVDKALTLYQELLKTS